MEFYYLDKKNFSSTNQKTNAFSKDMNLQEHLETTMKNSAANNIINNNLLYYIAFAYLQGYTHTTFMYESSIPTNCKEVILQELLKMGFSCIELKGKFLKKTPIALKVSWDKENAKTISIMVETIHKYGASEFILNELYKLAISKLENAAQNGQKSTSFYVSDNMLPRNYDAVFLAKQLENHLRKKGLNSQVVIESAINGCNTKISW